MYKNVYISYLYHACVKIMAAQYQELKLKEEYRIYEKKLVSHQEP